VAGRTRSHALRAALGGGEAVGIGGLVGRWTRPAVTAGQDPGSHDVEILNFALTLEYLEAAFYDEALSKAGLSGDVKKMAQEFGDHEKQHVDALTGAIKKAGGKPVKAPGVQFPLSDEKSFIKLAVTFEDTGVSAYNGAAPMISNKDVLAAAGSIAIKLTRISRASGVEPISTAASSAATRALLALAGSAFAAATLPTSMSD
jgi:hypothetical protein